MKKVDLKFYDNVKPLNIKDYKYWRRLLSKVLKVGAELEFNLNCNAGSCKGFSNYCVCLELAEEKCTAECVFFKNNTCELGIRNMTSCSNAADNCSTNMCENCDSFNFSCGKYRCLNYIAKCVTCDKLLGFCRDCGKKFDVNKNPESIRKTAEIQLEATQNFGYVGNKGVLQVVGDGSLENNGLEVPTVGRRLSFDVFKEMFKNILTVAKKNGGYSNDRCSFQLSLRYFQGRFFCPQFMLEFIQHTYFIFKFCKSVAMWSLLGNNGSDVISFFL